MINMLTEDIFWLYLLFSDHAKKMASKSQRAAIYLSMLVKTTRGVKVNILQRTIYAYILPILIYRTIVW